MSKPTPVSRGEYEVTVEGTFVASHQVHDRAGGLEPPHAHDWKVEVTFRGSNLNEQGMLVDFCVIEQRLREALAPLRGANLNQAPSLGGVSPTAEAIAAYLFTQMAALEKPGCRLYRVRVREAPGCSAGYVAARTGGP